MTRINQIKERKMDKGQGLQGVEYCVEEWGLYPKSSRRQLEVLSIRRKEQFSCFTKNAHSAGIMKTESASKAG